MLNSNVNLITQELRLLSAGKSVGLAGNKAKKGTGHISVGQQ